MPDFPDIPEQWNSPALQTAYDAVLPQLKTLYANNRCFPRAQDIFRALELTVPDKVKVVIIGQDPYHQPGQAHGLAFSVQQGIKVPPSLKNIYKEILAEYNLSDNILSASSLNGNLTGWGTQGVLLLNSALSVTESMPGSHKNIGWSAFINEIVRQVNSQNGVVWLLWGAHAASYKEQITNSTHLVLEAPHPSPLSCYRGFFGCGHFQKANDYLKEHHKAPVNWTSVIRD